MNLFHCSPHETDAARRPELNHVSENGEPNNPTQRATSPSPGEFSLDENTGEDQQENGGCNGEQPAPSNLSDEEKKNENDMNALSDVKNKEQEDSVAEANDAVSPLVEAKELNHPSDGEDAEKEKSAPVEAKFQLHNSGSDSTAKGSSMENLTPEKRRISHATSHKTGESATSGRPVSLPKEPLKQAQNGIQHSFNRVRSVGTVDTAELANRSSELSGALGKISNTSLTRSYNANGSISSYDEMNGAFSNQRIHPLQNPYSDADVVSKERPRRGKILANGKKYKDLKTQDYSINFSSDYPSRNHHVTRDIKGKQIEAVENARHGRPVQNWTRREMDEYPSRMPFHSRSGYESAGPSNPMRDKFYRSSGFLSHDAFEYEDPDQEKIKLMRMIYELQNQLNRTNFLNGEKQIPAYQSHDLHGGSYFHGSGYSTCDGMCRHGINRHRRQNFSHIPFSAESRSSSHDVDRSCPYCFPPERQWSAELPPHVVHQHEELYRFHPGHKSYLSRSTGPSSPRLYGHGTKHDNLRRRAPEVKQRQYHRQKQTLPKQHFRSVAGGAPFVTCYNCFQLLQLPADFLLYKRACHQLRCGACSEVLRFSLQNRIHIVPYGPNAVGPSPNELK